MAAAYPKLKLPSTPLFTNAANDPNTYKPMSAQAAATPKPMGAIPTQAPIGPMAGNIPLSAQQAISSAQQAHSGVNMPPSGGAMPQVQPKDPFAAANFGNKDNYVAGQQNRYNTAYAAGDTALMQRLEADVARPGVGGTLTKPMSADQAAGNISDTMPVSNNQTPSGGYVPPDYYSLAQGESALELARRQSRATQEKDSLTSAYNRSNQIQKDNRVLGDFTRTQTANPFGNMGRTSFNEGLVGRERSLADEQAQGQFNAGIGGIDQGLTDYENTAAAATRARAYQLEQDAKNYDLDYAGVYGHGQNGQQTAAQANADRSFNYGAGRDAIGDTRYTDETAYNRGRDTVGDTRYNDETAYNHGRDNVADTRYTDETAYSHGRDKIEDTRFAEEVKRQAPIIEQQLAAGKISNETAQYQLNELKNPKSVTNQRNSLALKLDKLNITGKEQEIAKIKADIKQIGVVKPKTLVEQKQEELKLAEAQDKLEKLQQGDKPKPATYDQAYKDIDSSMFLSPKVDEYGNKLGGTQVNDREGLADYIFSFGLTEPETKRLYQRYGLQWGE